MSASDRRLARAEQVCALGLAAALLAIHVSNLRHAPMLWRDEISTLHIATQPTFGALWAAMEWESSPLLWPLVLRAWTALGLGGDAFALRALAFGVGVAVIASLFLALRRIAGTLPLLSLVLVAANPQLVRFGDTLRAYGLGLVLAVLLVVALWRLALRVTPGRAAVAALAAVLAVQCLYHDAVVVFALCVACAGVWASRGRLREAAVPLAIGALAALTLLPYVGPLSRARAWNIVLRAPVDLAWLVAKVRATVEVGGPWLSLAWLGLAAALVAASARVFARRDSASAEDDERRAAAVFFPVALCAGVAAYALFLVSVGYPTQAWYYLSLLGLAGVAIEGGLARLHGADPRFRAARLALVVAGAALLAPALWRGHPARMTNLDRVAEALRAQARPDDLILVSPWYLAIAFDHYYAGGATPWLSIPDLPDRKLTRYDLVKEQMTRPDAVRPIADRVEQTLARRGRVWLVGELPLIEGNPPPQTPPVAPSSPLGWGELDYQLLWSREVAHRLQAHADRLTRVPIGELGVVSPFENPPLYRFDAGP